MSSNSQNKLNVFLPQTTFSMRAGLADREPQILDFWNSMHLEQKRTQTRLHAPKFVLHDGPPYANGHLHLGHALNKVLKDMINRLRWAQGYDISFRPGWDCHGLPIEAKVEETFLKSGQKKRDVSPTQFRTACREFAKKWTDIQRKEFLRLGVVGAWNNPYSTMTPEAETAIVSAFFDLFMKGYITQGVKPVLWSVVEETALAEAEVEYKDIESPAIYVGFKITHVPPPLLERVPGLLGASALIWTTTPWTIPANRAIAFHDELTYVLLRICSASKNFPHTGQYILIAEACVDTTLKTCGIIEAQKIATLLGRDLRGIIAQHPWHASGLNFDVPLLPGFHVTADTGTGLVHTAPSHGVEDFGLGKAYQLEIPDLVSASGLFHEDVPFVGGMHVYKANPAVIKALQDASSLFHHNHLRHSYPHSWRSKKPLIYRTTPQWFLTFDAPHNLRQKMLSEIQHVRWIPSSGKRRITSMVEGRPDWCLSRQRVWGVPIALFLHKKTGEPLCDAQLNERVLEIFKREGTDAWWSHPKEGFLEGLYPAEEYIKSTDILDVWFDSGVTHLFALDAEKAWPADLYLEGSDQHRGWFQSSLVTACALKGRAPYKSVLTHGFVIDDGGHKMSKSLGNVTTPQEIISTKGADILRLWIATSNTAEDIRMSGEILKRTEDIYRRLRNTFRYLLGSLCDFSHKECVPYDHLPELERWVLHQLRTLECEVTQASNAYNFQEALQHIHHFCSIDLSAFYFDVRKDTLYCDTRSSPLRRGAQTVFQVVLDHLVRWLAPFIPFTTEEVWQKIREDIPQSFKEKTLTESVHLKESPQCPKKWHQPSIAKKYDHLRQIRGLMTKALEIEREERRIRSSLEGSLTLFVPTQGESWYKDLEATLLKELSIVSQLTISYTDTLPTDVVVDEALEGFGVCVQKAPGVKCERCWKIVEGIETYCTRCQDVMKEESC
jgi:isoleucyl-tRNA synthetase